MEAHRAVITRFGGIREAARKLGHNSHTTVQGWWDRSNIPIDRWAELKLAADRHDIKFEMAELMPAEALASDAEAAPEAEAA
jgi:hypothetical protein